MQALAGGLVPSSLYDGEHLLRALQRLPALLRVLNSRPCARAGAGGRPGAQQPVRRGAPAAPAAAPVRAAAAYSTVDPVPVQALAGGLVPSSLYGGEHLLRLLQRLPALLQRTQQ